MFLTDKHLLVATHRGVNSCGAQTSSLHSPGAPVPGLTPSACPGSHDTQPAWPRHLLLLQGMSWLPETPRSVFSRDLRRKLVHKLLPFSLGEEKRSASYCKWKIRNMRYVKRNEDTMNVTGAGGWAARGALAASCQVQNNNDAIPKVAAGGSDNESAVAGSHPHLRPAHSGGNSPGRRLFSHKSD